MGLSKHKDAIAAEIARIEAQLDRNSLWQELKTFETSGLLNAAGPRVLSLLESLEADPLYAAHGKLVEALKILESAVTQGDALSETLPLAGASGKGRSGRSDPSRKTQKRSRKRATKSVAGRTKKPARKKSLPRLESLGSRLARMGSGAADADTPDTTAMVCSASDNDGTRDALVRGQTSEAQDARPAGASPSDDLRVGRRRPLLSSLDVPEADVDIRPSQASGSAREDTSNGD